MKKAAFLLALASTAYSATAQENNDLSLIPGTVQSAPQQDIAAPGHGKYSLENAFGWYSYRGTLAVPLAGDMPSRWANRTSFDGLDQWTLAPALTVTASDRLSANFADGVGFPNESVRNDLREAYLSWEAAPQTYLEAGRINVRYGTAYGYNPTDFFRGRTSVAQSSADPSSTRTNRLGTVMLRGQYFFDGGAVEVLYAPKLHAPVAIGSVPNPLDPKIDQTNGSDRALAAFSFELEEFSPQFLVYYDSGRTKFGLNLSHPIGGSVIAYASWAGGNAPTAIVDAIAFGKRTRTLPSTVPVLPATSLSHSFKSDLSLGAYWTGEAKVTLSAEYNFHEAGFSRSDWRSWFANGANPNLSQLMWYIRSYASDQSQPMGRHQVFVRADWTEPFHIEHTDVSAFVMTDLSDGSSFGQVSLSYDISDHWSAGIYAGGNWGGKKSEWGSLRNAGSIIFQLARYL